MKYKKLIISILFIMAVFLLFACKKKVNKNDSPLNKDHSNDPYSTSDVTIDMNVYEDKDGDVLLNMVKVDQIILPEQYGVENSALLDAIDIYNAERDTEGKRFLEEQKNEIRVMRNERNDDTLVLSYEDVVVVNRIDDDVFSFMEELSTYTGGAHGSYMPLGKNYIVKNGKELTSSEIFTNDNKLKKILIDKIKEEYGEEQLFPEWVDTLEAHFDEKKPFNILVGTDFVDVIFDPYYLAPWSTGTITITLPYEEYSDILNKKYF